jgi:hypothetical protein
MAAWMPAAVPTVMALAGVMAATAVSAEAAVSERSSLRIQISPELLQATLRMSIPVI